MSRSGTLILFGVLTMLVPFSGLPILIRHGLTVIFGIVIVSIGLSMRTHVSTTPHVEEKIPEPPIGVSPI